MVARTWAGSADNEASNPNSWSPAGAPQLGDGLGLTISGTMNIKGNALAGNALSIGIYKGSYDPTLQDTLNLSRNAVVKASVPQHASVDLTVNVSGNDSFDYTSSLQTSTDLAIDLRPGSSLSSKLSLTGGDLSITGEHGSTIVNNSVSELVNEHAVITPSVLGIGTTYVNVGFLELEGFVSSGQTVEMRNDFSMGTTSGTLQLDHPEAFRGTVDIQGGAEIDLAGLAKADSYTYQNDMLSIYAGRRVVDTLRLDNSSGQDLVVSKNGSDVWVTESGTNSAPAGSVTLPVHSMTMARHGFNF